MEFSCLRGLYYWFNSGFFSAGFWLWLVFCLAWDFYYNCSSFGVSFLLVSPDNLGFEILEKEFEMSVETVALVDSEKGELEEEDLVGSEDEGVSVAIGFLEAWRLPGVAPYPFSLFCSKLIAYTFMYWLPFYLRHTAIAGVHLSHRTAGILSTSFDIGGVVGGILAGFISDLIEAQAISSFLFLLLSIPALVFYSIYGSVSMLLNIALIFYFWVTGQRTILANYNSHGH